MRIESSLEPIERLPLSLSPTLSSLEAFSAAVKHLGWSIDAIQDDSFPARLVMCRPDHAGEGADLNRFRLCWMLQIAPYKQAFAAATIVFIDAINGALVKRYAATHGSGSGYYSTQLNPNLNSTSVDNTYRLIDEKTSKDWLLHKPKIHTYDDAGGNSLSLAIYSESTSNEWNNTAGVGERFENQAPEVDVHRYLGIALTYFHAIDLRNISSRTGTPPWASDFHAHVHHNSSQYPSYWSPSRNSMYFGDGESSDRVSDQPQSSRDYITTLDAVAHEFTHAILTRLGKFPDYAKESASLAEALCDFFAYVIQYINRQPGDTPHEYGYRYFIPPNPQSVPPTRTRSIKSPSCTDPGNFYPYTVELTDAEKESLYDKGYTFDHYDNKFAYDGTVNSNKVIYWNSTIISHALYLMANGGTHRLGTTVREIGHDIVANIVYHALACNGVYANDSTIFECFGQRMVSSCRDMYSNNNHLLQYLTSIKSAFFAVGVGYDLYIRDTLDDGGEEPGTLSAMSPDIIVRRKKADSVTLDQIRDSTIDNLCENIEFGSPLHEHYVYFRAFRRGGTPQGSVTIDLHVSCYFGVFQPPEAWKYIGSLKLSTNGWGTPVDGVTTWSPETPDDCIKIATDIIEDLNVGHLCFIARISSEFDPAPDKDAIATLNDYYRVIAESNNCAWRNCNIVEVPAPSPTQSLTAITVNFKINRFKNDPGPRELEVDTKDLPEGTQLIAWLPGKRLQRLTAHGHRLELHRAANRFTGRVNRTGAPLSRPTRIPKEILTHPVPSRDFWPTGVSSDRLRELRPLTIPSRKYRTVTLSGLTPCRDDDTESYTVYLVIQFPKGIAAQSIPLSIREFIASGVVGQVNYIFQIE